MENLHTYQVKKKVVKQLSLLPMAVKAFQKIRWKLFLSHLKGWKIQDREIVEAQDFD